MMIICVMVIVFVCGDCMCDGGCVCVLGCLWVCVVMVGGMVYVCKCMSSGGFAHLVPHIWCG